MTLQQNSRRQCLQGNRQEMKHTRSKGGSTLDSGNVLFISLKQQSVRGSCRCYKLTHTRQRVKNTGQGGCDSHWPGGRGGVTGGWPLHSVPPLPALLHRWESSQWDPHMSLHTNTYLGGLLTYATQSTVLQHPEYCAAELSSGMSPLKAPIMIAENCKIHCAFLSCSLGRRSADTFVHLKIKLMIEWSHAEQRCRHDPGENN